MAEPGAATHHASKVEPRATAGLDGFGEAPGWLRAAASIIRHLPAGRYRAMNRFRRGRFAARMPEGLGGMRFACDLRDLIAREVFFTGVYGPQETALLRAMLRPGGTFVDVGANWGYFTLLGAHLVGAAGTVVALEPDPRLFALLEANVAANGLRQVAALPVAAAEAEGEVVLAGHDPERGNWGLSSIVTDSAEGERFAVRGRRIDDVLHERGIARVDLLKMDIEGAELLALGGMADGLARGRHRRVLLELHPTLHPRGAALAGDAAAIFIAHGYRGWSVDHSAEATRCAAYAGVDPRSLLRPLDAAASPSDGDAWPHQLWTAPGEDPL